MPFRDLVSGAALSRRELLVGAVAAAATGLLPIASPAARTSAVRWRPYHNLDLDPGDMVRDRDIARVVRFTKHFVPQTNSGRPAYDPRQPTKPGTERPMEGMGKRIRASELSPCTPNTYRKAVAIKKGIARLLAADQDGAVREILGVGLQFYTTNFDHPEDGVTVPRGFEWDWVMTVPLEVAEEHRRAWTRAGYRVSETPSVRLAASKAKGRGWPTGWLRVDEKERTAVQYTFMPDLRIRECRTYFLDRRAAINEELGIVNVDLGGKSGWLHGNALPRNRPEAPTPADPWLPSPYPGDSYRDANVALVREAVARFGAERVTWTNSGIPTRAERRAQKLPDYVSLRDGGIRAVFDNWYGSWVSAWTLELLAKKGML